MGKFVGFLAWAALLLSAYVVAGIYGYSPFGDGHAPRDPSGVRSGSVHK